VLDALLVEAAAESGAELIERFAVDEVLWSDGRAAGVRGRHPGAAASSLRAAVVVGADGLHSGIARQTGARAYREHPPMTAVYYSYWSGIRSLGASFHARPGQLILVWPTNDDLTCIYVAWPRQGFHQVRRDIERHFHSALDLVPGLREAVASGHRAVRFTGTGDLPNYYRASAGPGWALVGDAGHRKDPCTGMGISDAFLTAELLAGAIHSALVGRQPMDRALARYQQQRDVQTANGFDLTLSTARLAPLTPRLEALYRAAADDSEAARRIFGVLGGSIPLTSLGTRVGLLLASARSQAGAADMNIQSPAAGPAPAGDGVPTSARIGMFLPFGLLEQGPETARAFLASAEKEGIDHVCCSDHVSFAGTGFDGLVQATALAMLHATLPVYCGVYLLPLRHPVPVARQLADIARLAPGRLIFGTGIGGEERREITICGVNPATRGLLMNESLAVVRQLLTGKAVTFHGTFFDLDEAVIAPAPAEPVPIIVGGRSDAAIRRAGRLGDGWLGIWNSPRRFAAAVEMAAQEAARAGRPDPPRRHAMQVWCGLADSRQAARACLATTMEAFYQAPFEQFERYCPYGTAEDVAEFLTPYAAAGCTEFNLIPQAPDPGQAIAGAAAVKRLLARS
jgi:alkanesulfonate monooxygenase SsuD/methylene tetrahydromethanopterin reductase-like flavin-dependent oxidoreductase (luciferase family)/2-polyprenyl-6-methoxyphenol hydroxylase-like FAD-dependent oxidoreductase